MSGLDRGHWSPRQFPAVNSYFYLRRVVAGHLLIANRGYLIS